MIRSEEFIVIPGWMRNLDLTDKQLTTYAIIWGNSKDGRSCWRGTASDVAKWAGCQERQARNIIRQLEDKGLVGHDVVAWSNGRNGGVRSEFWAILPGMATAPAKGTKSKINWRGSCKGVVQRSARWGSATECLTPLTLSRYSNISSCGGNNTARRARKETTTTTGFLFENNIGLTPEDLPYKESYFVEAWEALLKQPKWQDKTVEALKITLDDLAAVYDPVIAAYCCRLAITKGWDNISNPQKIYEDDEEKVMAFSRLVNSREEEARDEK